MLWTMSLMALTQKEGCCDHSRHFMVLLQLYLLNVQCGYSNYFASLNVLKMQMSLISIFDLSCHDQIRPSKAVSSLTDVQPYMSPRRNTDSNWSSTLRINHVWNLSEVGSDCLCTQSGVNNGLKWVIIKVNHHHVNFFQAVTMSTHFHWHISDIMLVIPSTSDSLNRSIHQGQILGPANFEE